MKKLVALMLALIMVLSVVSVSFAADITLPILSEKQTFKIMIKKENLCQNTWAEKECVIRAEEDTNIHVEWEEVDSSAWDEKVSLAFASSTLPDAIVCGGKVVDIVTNKDVLVALDDYINETDTPNIVQMFADLPDMRGALTLEDGHIYSLPTGDSDTKNQINSMLWINTTWLENLGLSMPTNMDEFMTVLRAFKEQDANGNGDPNDEIPLLVSSSSDAAKINGLFAFWGTYEDNYHVRVQDGQCIFTPGEDAYFQALNWMHELYAEGLMNESYFTEDYQQFLAKGNAETCITGVVAEWYIDNIILKSNVGQFTYMPLFDGPNGKTIWPADVGHNSPLANLNGFVITQNCKDPAALVRWYDYINSSLEILNLWNYGPVDVIWRYCDDGRWELFNDNVPEGSSSSQIRRTLGTGPSSPVFAYARFRGPQAEKYADRITAKVEAVEAYKPFLAEERIPNGYGNAEEEEERNMMLVEIDNYLNQFRANAVVNGVTEADWQKHLSTLQSLDVDTYVAFWQSFYDQHK